ncbi:MAG: protein kinase [Verrucomicrobiales bacterium]|nr:protein kinase [Verrucomicrobiales bacterium]
MAGDLRIPEATGEVDSTPSGASGTPAHLPAPTDQSPPAIPDHTLLQPIAGGSYGEVWLARSTLGTWRAVKMVHRRSFDHDRPYEREFAGLQRYEPVSRSHEHLVDVLQVGRNDAVGYFYYVMEVADAIGSSKGEGRSSKDEVRRANFEGRSSMGEVRRAKVEGRKTKSEGREDGASKTEASLPAEAGERALDLELRTSKLELRTSKSGLRPSPFYQPRTLLHDLRTRGCLPFEECVRVGLALTSALAHLHRHGLVHRDVKPSNIIFVDGVPKLADVGLVAATNEARSFVGTPGYIAPEGPGTPAADLYSLGKVLYELSTGRDRQDFPQLPVDLPLGVERSRWLEWNEVLTRACDPDPRRRYAAAETMRADLERVERGQSVRAHWRAARARAIGSKALLALVLTLAAWFTVSRATRRDTRPVPGESGVQASVFVLPFRAEPRRYGWWKGDPLANRLTDALMDSLALIPGVQVGPRKSGWVMEEEAGLRERVQREFGAREVVTGRVRTVTNGWEVTLALWDAGARGARWSDSFRGETNALLALERQMVHAVGRELGLNLTATVRAAVGDALSRNVEAWKLTCRAEARRSEVSRDGLTAATELAYQALAADPNCVEARMVLASTYRNLSGLRPPREVWPQLRDLAGQALQVDATAFRARYWLAWARICHDYDWEAGVRELEQVLPAEDHLNRAILYRWLGRLDAARTEQDQLERRNLVDSTVCFHSLKARFVERRYAEGIREALRWSGLLPESIIPQVCLAQLAMESGDYTTAREAIEMVRRRDDSPEYLALDGRCWALMGRRDEADRVLGELEAMSRTQYVNPYFVARIRAGLRDRGKALEALERAVEDRAEEIVNADWGGLRTDPAWDDLQDEPRFQALLRRAGLDVWPK